MKNGVIKRLTPLILTAISLCAFAGCETTVMRQFNARGIAHLTEFREDFLETNRIYDAPYLNENGECVLDKTSPKYRTYIITEKAQVDEVFSVCPEIDFEKEMVVMYAFSCTSFNGIKFTSITLDNKILKIKFKYKKGKPGYKTGIPPETAFLRLLMDKLDITKVEFTLLNP